MGQRPLDLPPLGRRPGLAQGLEAAVAGIGRSQRLRKQVPGPKQGLFGQGHRPFDPVDQLPHIARPGPGERRLHRRRRQAADRHPETPCELADIAIEQRRDVLGTLAQRRHAHRQHVDAIIEIGTKAARLHIPLEIAVGGADQPCGKGQRPLATDPLEAAILHQPQQLGLGRRRQFGHLVEKQTAALGAFGMAAMAGKGAGEGAPLVAEQLAFHQLGGNRRAVDGHEGGIGARRDGMQEAGADLLADAAFAEEQHVAVDPSHPPEQGLDGSHRRRTTETALVARRFAADQIAHLGDQRLDGEGLGDVIDRPGAHQPHRLLDIAEGGDEQEGNRSQ